MGACRQGSAAGLDFSFWGSLRASSAVPIQVTASVGNGSYLCGTGYATQCLGCLYMSSCCTLFQY